jgi:hypothetical protein
MWKVKRGCLPCPAEHCHLRSPCPTAATSGTGPSVSAWSARSTCGDGALCAMSDGRAELDRRAVDLLLDIVELPDPALSGAALEDFFCGTAERLLSSGLLKPAGYEAVSASLADHDEVPVTLSWSAEARGYGYFSPTAGWVTVPNDRLARYRADVPTVISAVMSMTGLSSRARRDSCGMSASFASVGGPTVCRSGSGGVSTIRLCGDRSRMLRGLDRARVSGFC